MGERVAIVGLGRISRLHVEALEGIRGVDVLGGFDIDRNKRLTYRGRTCPVFDSLEHLLSAHPTTVIVATPTTLHFETCGEVLSGGRSPARLLVEKPIGTSLYQVEKLLETPPEQTEIAAVYHAAHAPEVLWAAERIATWEATHGPIVGYEASFADPYRNLDRTQRDRVYVNSWFDSGINALSVALRFVTLLDVRSTRCSGPADSAYQADVRFTSDTRVRHGSIRTSWDVDAAEKQTIIKFESGALLRLDHQNVRGMIGQEGRVVDSFFYRGDTPRLVLHYRNFFTSFFVNRAAGCYGLSDSLLLHRLLFSEHH
jgi:predicted dehydrogenase